MSFVGDVHQSKVRFWAEKMPEAQIAAQSALALAEATRVGVGGVSERILDELK